MICTAGIRAAPSDGATTPCEAPLSSVVGWSTVIGARRGCLMRPPSADVRAACEGRDRQTRADVAARVCHADGRVAGSNARRRALGRADEAPSTRRLTSSTCSTSAKLDALFNLRSGSVRPEPRSATSSRRPKRTHQTPSAYILPKAERRRRTPAWADPGTGLTTSRRPKR